MASNKERFSKKYKVNNETECWEWTGATNSNGRAAFSIAGKAILAHRFAYELFVAPIGANQDVRRSCNNPICVNTNHMYIYTHDDNERLWNNVEMSESGHWYWDGPRLFKSEGKASSPRRAVYTNYLNQTPPKSLRAICGESDCINPLHCGGLEDSFWSKVDKNDDGHWYWTGPILQSGYAHVSYKGTNQYVHRIAWDLTNGIKPQNNEVIYHICRVKSCVNPEHLTVATHGEMGEIKRLNSELS